MVDNKVNKASEKETYTDARTVQSFKESKLDSKFGSMLTDLGLEIIMKISSGGNTSVEVVDAKSKDPVGTLEDLQRTGRIKSIIKNETDKHKEGIDIIDSLFIIAKEWNDSGETGKAFTLNPEQGQKAIGINIWTRNLQNLTEKMEIFKGKGGDFYVTEFRNLMIAYTGIIVEMYSGIRKALYGGKPLESVLLEKLLEVGVPKWFHHAVIVNFKQFSNRIDFSFPMKLFFMADGSSSITVTTEEILKKNLHENLGFVVSNSKFMFTIVAQLMEGEENLSRAGFVPSNYAETEILQGFKWPVTIKVKDVDVLFQQKARGKVSPVIGYGSIKYSDRLMRICLAMTKTAVLECNSIEDTIGVFTDVFGSDFETSAFDGGNVYELAARIHGFQKKYLNFLEQKGTGWKSFIKLLSCNLGQSVFEQEYGSLTKFCQDQPTSTLLKGEANHINYANRMFYEDLRDMEDTTVFVEISDKVKAAKDYASYKDEVNLNILQARLMSEFVKIYDTEEAKDHTEVGELIGIERRLDYYSGSYNLARAVNCSVRDESEYEDDVKFLTPVVDEDTKKTARLISQFKTEEVDDFKNITSHRFTKEAAEVLMCVPEFKAFSLETRKKIRTLIQTFGQTRYQVYVATTVAATYRELLTEKTEEENEENEDHLGDLFK